VPEFARAKTPTGVPHRRGGARSGAAKGLRRDGMRLPLSVDFAAGVRRGFPSLSTGAVRS